MGAKYTPPQVAPLISDGRSGTTASSMVAQDAKIILIATGVPRADPADIFQVL